ncbi:Cysteine desulfurase [Fructilactobacillus florum 8D]|uniref:Cysteine desulfurase n=1 Tax=Fructilactobacillus florum 8D TaxID=1221538 RepID=W9EFF8_9LACO|nr:cysteine desulfurase family protein [Fructilactobacillus florum]EKK20306.1 Cysteine desulfurase [Fructilactobacillus florum 2F]ETO39981.1 Cysteine desulfurase [Fructilactobacillus florum 8D]
MEEVYLDNAATTPISSAVLAELTDRYQHVFGNASTLYGLGRAANQVLEQARHTMATSIHADDEEIVFTSGGTESDNTAIIKTAEARQALGNHLITTAVEHEAVLKSMAYLEERGFRVTYLPVDETGQLSLADLENALDDETILVSIMSVNNEVGTRMPIHEIGERLKNHQAWFHTDAVQAYGLEDIDVKRDHIDMLSTSAHKINGPKLLGFLYRQKDLQFSSYLLGGDQEDKRRAGTENVPAIAGFATAVAALDASERTQRAERFQAFKLQILQQFKKHQIEVKVNGTLDQHTSPHILSLWFPGISTYVLQNNLDLEGIAVSGGSACTAGNLAPSHVLTALFGKQSPRLEESIRLSFGQATTSSEIEIFTTAVIKIIRRLAARRS